MPAKNLTKNLSNFMRSLLWLRHDLRVFDNPVLKSAIESGNEGVVALFIITPSQWKRHGWGNPRVSFLMACLNNLVEGLKTLNIPLLVRQVDFFKDVPELILEIATQHACKTIHAGREFGVAEDRRDRDVARMLAGAGVAFQRHEDQTILPIDEIRTKAGKPYSVFTPFRKRWDKLFEEKGVSDAVLPDACIQKFVESDEVPKNVTGFDSSPVIRFWDSKSQTAQERLDQFLTRTIDNYHRCRDRPDLEGTSTLSPWLAVGAISPHTCLRPLVDRYGRNFDQWPEGPRTWRTELVWREFYRYVMSTQPQLSMDRPMHAWTDCVTWRDDERGFKAWCEGCTGIPLVDTGMRQLAATGWMHNRLRMVTAMFLTKNLLMDWRRGERFFAKMLVDYDFASNNGGWQWAASTGTDAVPYFRIFNPLLQAKRFDPEGTFVRSWNAGDTSSRSINPIVDLQFTRQRAILAF